MGEYQGFEDRTEELEQEEIIQDLIALMRITEAVIEARQAKIEKQLQWDLHHPFLAKIRKFFKGES